MNASSGLNAPPGMRKKNGFYERSYSPEQWDKLERKLLGLDEKPKVPGVPGISDVSESLEGASIPTIPVGIPRKVL